MRDLPVVPLTAVVSLITVVALALVLFAAVVALAVVPLAHCGSVINTNTGDPKPLSTNL